jgi:regulator of sigma E protease
MVLFNSVHKSSLISGIYFTVVISFALAIFNLLPFPVLDGGHIVFGLIEMALGRPLPNCLIKILSNIFVALLIGLMIFVTFSDSRRLYREFFPASEGEKKNAVPPAAKP